MGMEWEKSEHFEEHRKYLLLNQERFVEVLRKNGVKSKRMLDIGCYTGEFTVRIANVVGAEEVYGLDMNEEALKEAQKRGVTPIMGNIERGIPAEDGFFDLVTANQVLEHVEGTARAFREIRRVLKPGGYAMISVPNLASWHNILLLLLGMQPSSYHVYDVQVGNPLHGISLKNPYSEEIKPHVKAFTLPALVDIAKLNGFEVIDTYGCGFYKLPVAVSKLLSKIDRRHAIYIGVLLRKEWG